MAGDIKLLGFDQEASFNYSFKALNLYENEPAFEKITQRTLSKKIRENRMIMLVHESRFPECPSTEHGPVKNEKYVT